MWAAALVAVATTLAPAGCSPPRGPAPPIAAGPESECPGGVLDETVPETPPPEPVGDGCLTHASVESLLGRLGKGMVAVSEVRLVSAACRKRVYLAPNARFVFWDTDDSVHGKVVTRSCALPTDACIERALVLARDYVPFADAIMQREATQNPALWRDPDVGAVSYLKCDLADQPDFMSIDTMLHETNHRLSPDKCIFDYATAGELCFELPRDLPEGMIAAYPGPPGALDADAAEWFAHVQKTYLVDNGHGIRELLDEVMAYSITSRMLAVGAARRIYPLPGHSTYNNLPLLMAFASRYLEALATHDPALAAREFGANGRNRAALLAVLGRGEAAYEAWLQAVPVPGVFERTFWADYQRGRQALERLP